MLSREFKKTPEFTEHKIASDFLLKYCDSEIPFVFR